MKRNIGNVMFAIIVLFFMLVVLPSSGECQQRGVSIIRQTSNPEGSAIYEMNVAMAKVAADNSKKFKVATSTARSVAHCMRLVDSGEAESSYAELYSMKQCYNNIGAWKISPQRKKPWGGIWTYTMAFFIVTKAERTDINSLKDLAGKTWNHGPQASAPPQVWTEAFKALGIYNSMRVKYTSLSEEPESLISGVADAILAHTIMGGRGIASRAQDLDARCRFKVVQPTDEEWEIIKNKADITPFYQVETPLEIYNQKLNVKKARALEFSGGFAFSPDADADVIYEYTKIMFEHAGALEKITPQLKEFKSDGLKLNKNANDVLGKLGIPIHPGVARYLKEIGAWNKNWIEGKK